MIRFDNHLHRAGEGVAANAAATQAAAWWVAAELVRRHPKRLMVIETHPAGGMYDCLSVYRRERVPNSEPDKPGKLILHMNLDGGAHLTHGAWFEMSEAAQSEERFNWPEVILSNRRRSYVIEQLEAVERLSVPKRAPCTTRRSIGPRVISAFVGRTAFGRGSDREASDRGELPWTMINGWSLSESYSSYRSELFDPFPEIGFRPPADGLPGADEAPVYDYWFAVDQEGDPSVAVDVSRGRAWTPGEQDLDLLTAYSANGRRIDSIVNTIFPDIQ